ncbi:MAG: TIGR02301 family protein [Xanthobacteraceae bacterium]
MLRIFTFLLLFLCLGGQTASAQIFLPQTQPQAQPKPQPQVQPRAQPQAQPQAPPPPRTAPYDRDMQRLSEILGALHFLRGICGTNEGQKWRSEAQALIEAEASSGERRDQMVSSFNRGYRSFQQSYRTCTPAADFAIRRYLDEGARIAREITARYAN